MLIKNDSCFVVSDLFAMIFPKAPIASRKYARHQTITKVGAERRPRHSTIPLRPVFLLAFEGSLSLWASNGIKDKQPQAGRPKEALQRLRSERLHCIFVSASTNCFYSLIMHLLWFWSLGRVAIAHLDARIQLELNVTWPENRASLVRPESYSPASTLQARWRGAEESILVLSQDVSEGQSLQTTIKLLYETRYKIDWVTPLGSPRLAKPEHLLKLCRDSDITRLHSHSGLGLHETRPEARFPLRARCRGWLGLKYQQRQCCLHAQLHHQQGSRTARSVSAPQKCSSHSRVIPGKQISISASSMALTEMEPLYRATGFDSSMALPWCKHDHIGFRRREDFLSLAIPFGPSC